MVHDSFGLEMNKVHNFFIFLFVRCYTVIPVSMMNSVVRHNVVSSRLVKMQIFPGHDLLQFRSICFVVCQSSSLPSCKVSLFYISISAGFMVPAIHMGVTDMSRARASCCFQFLGFMDKSTTVQSILGVALPIAFHVMVR